MKNKHRNHDHEDGELCNKGGDKCYCGPWYFPAKLKCVISEWFNRPCRRHDHDYRMNNGRFASDWRFYIGMFKLSGYNPIKHLVALVFYIFVFLLGWISYYWGGDKGPEKD